jgi:hypothetical protein
LLDDLAIYALFPKENPASIYLPVAGFPLFPFCITPNRLTQIVQSDSSGIPIAIYLVNVSAVTWEKDA